MATTKAPYSTAPFMQTKVKVDTAGRVLIPAEFRKALGVTPGQYLIIRVEDGELKGWTFVEGIRRAREIVAKYVPADVSLVDELIAERRRETAIEERGD